MCGIAGWFSPNQVQSIDKELESGIKNRGSDNFSSCRISHNHFQGSLLHSRLAIMDPVERSNQPFYKYSGNCCIVFNGEIYNFKQLRERLSKRHQIQFITEGDTEVIYEGIRVEGPGFLNLIDGEFSFFYLDLSRGCGLLGRDFFGKKPLSYSINNNVFKFSSNEKSLGSLALSNLGLFSIFKIGYIPEGMELFERVVSVSPGEFIEINLSNNSVAKSGFISPVLDKISIWDSVHNSTDLQTTSDVPIGLFLSGGFDSTMVAGILSDRDLNTYSFILNDINSEEYLIDEWIREKGKGFNLQKINSSEIDLESILPEILSTVYRPTYDSSIVPTHCLTKLAKESGVKVILTGIGGDEMFGGYNRYLKRRVLSQFDLSALSKMGEYINNETIYRLGDLDYDLAMSASLPNTLWMGCNLSVKSGAKEISRFLRHKPKGHNVKDMLNSDLFNYTVDLLHRQYDAISLANDVEIRSPIISLPVYHSILDTPAHNFFKKGVAKSLQKNIFSKYFNESQYLAGKSGFSGPITSWVGKHKLFFDHYSRNGFVNDNFKVHPTTDYDKWILSCVNLWCEGL